MLHFSADVVGAVLAHMNTDHAADNQVIVRAFAEPDATSARMCGLDGEAGEWVATVAGAERTVRIEWGTPLTERAGIRREVALLYR